MDRELSTETKTRRKRKRLLTITGIVLAVVLIILLFNRLITRPVNRNELIIATAVRGDIHATLNASGTIQPEFEEVITTPVASRILKVLVPAGAPLDSGSSIIELDLSEVTAQVGQSEDHLRLLHAQYEKTRLSLEKTLSELESQRDIRRLKNQWYKQEVGSVQKLFAIGGAMKEEVSKATLDYEIATLELSQLERQIENLKQSTMAQLNEMELNIRIQERQLGELRAKRSLSRITAGRPGVITWVNDQIGSHVEPGEVVARVADLRSFQVDATISDIYADRIYQGQKVLVRVNDRQLPGSIATIQPAVKNGFISFSANLNDRSDPALRPHMQVDVYPVTESKCNAILLPRESAFSGSEEQYLFVISGDRAIRRTVTTGLSNYDVVEITSGIQEGEEVIVSTMKAYERRKTITIK